MRIIVAFIVACAAITPACRRDIPVDEKYFKDDKGSTPQADPSAEPSFDPSVDCNKGFQTVLDGSACSVRDGRDGLLIHSNIIGPDKLWKGGFIRVDNSGKITCAGCDCDKDAAAEKRLDCPDVVVSPGLINAHDHLGWANLGPVAHSEKYNHRHDWRKGGRGDTKVNTSGGSSKTESVQLGELRFILSGATATIASTVADKFMRNLDGGMEGLSKNPVSYETFPLGDSGTSSDNSEDLLRASGCAYDSFSGPRSGASAYFPHLSEGIDKEARNEFTCLAHAENGGRAWIGDHTAAIHGIGLKLEDAVFMATQKASLVWSPRSNIDLYGDTARVTLMARVGVNIALGTDWLPSGSMNMSRELACVDDLNRTHFGKFFSNKQIVDMATSNAARAAHMDDVIGAIAADHMADLAFFKGAAKAYRAVIEGRPETVVLVMRAGKALYGDAAVIAALTTKDECEILDVCGTSKRVCVQSEVGMQLSALKAAAAHSYPLFACGAPPSEPSCTPTRSNEDGDGIVFDGRAAADDSDGDGVKDSVDSCPTIFNPPRPLDDTSDGVHTQADDDSDGDGDACDPCPMYSERSECTEISLDDDFDGVPNDDDNCRNVANAEQIDGDKDGKGDACDPCPDRSNPGDARCPLTRLRLAQALVNPLGNDKGHEWVTIYNAGTDPVTLTGYSIAIGGSPALSTRISLSGAIGAGQCLLVHEGQSDSNNGTPSIATPPAGFATPLKVDWPGSGIFNPAAKANAIALFSPVSADLPQDLVVYVQGTAPITSGYTGPDGNKTEAMVYATDVLEGKAMLRTGVSTWVVNPSGMTPDVCPHID